MFFTKLWVICQVRTIGNLCRNLSKTLLKYIFKRLVKETKHL